MGHHRAVRHAALVGVTASGKSALALEVARRRPGTELVSVDSMQVYRGMDIGTAKPTAAEQAEVRHHLIDLVDPDEEYTVARFQQDLAEVLAGLYLRAAVDALEIPGRYPAIRAELEGEPDTAALHRRLDRLDPVAAARMEPSNRRRIVRALEVTVGAGRPFSSFGPGLDQHPPSSFRLLGVRLPRPVVDRRIEARYQAQLAAGFVAEVAALAARPGGLSRTARQALGYRELLAHVEDGAPLDECMATAVVRTRRFARRQDRWFRRDPRITWFEPAPEVGDDPALVVDDLLAELDRT